MGSNCVLFLNVMVARIYYAYINRYYGMSEMRHGHVRMREQFAACILKFEGKGTVQRKYFFFDYDGTLAVPRTREIPASTQETLRRLREKGHFIALATGRLQINAIDFISSIGMENVVADGGYSVTIDGELKWMDSLPLEPVKECLRILDEHRIPWAVTTANELVRYSPYGDFAQIAGDYYVPTEYAPSLSIDGLTRVYKIYIPCKAEDEERVRATGALDGVPHVRYNSDTIFIEPMDKQRGIMYMMDVLGVPYSEVVVFGDGYNDVSMFRPEWTSIAMGNARDVLKERADYITTDCDDDGIMNACKHFGWI